jgi:hypothetical protein
MNRTALALGAILALSLLVNILAMSRLSGMRGELDEIKKRARPAAEKTAGPATAPDDRIDQLAAEVARLRTEIARGKGAAAPAGPGPAAPAPATTNPRVNDALADAETYDLFWSNVKKLAKHAEGMDEQEYRGLVFEASAEFLAIDRASLAAAAEQMIKEMAEAQKAYQAEWRELWPLIQKDPKAYEGQSKALHDRQEAALAAARDRVTRLLQPETNKRHKRFAAQLDRWTEAVRDPEFVNDD